MQIIVSIIGLVATAATVVRGMILAGFCRARIAAVWTAWIATCTKVINSKADAYIRSLPPAQLISKNGYKIAGEWEASVKVSYAGAQWEAWAIGKPTYEAAVNAAFKCAAAAGAQATRAQKVTELTIEAQNALRVATTGLPAGIAAFFLNNPTGACNETGGQGLLEVEIFVDVTATLKAKAEKASVKNRTYMAYGTCCTGAGNCCAVTDECIEVLEKPHWKADGSPTLNYKLRIAEKPALFCDEIYSQIKQWVDSLDGEAVSRQIIPPPKPPVDEWAKNELDKWVDKINEGEAVPRTPCTTPTGGSGSCNFGNFMLVNEQGQGVGSYNPPKRREVEIDRYLGVAKIVSPIKAETNSCQGDCNYEGDCEECSSEGC